MALEFSSAPALITRVGSDHSAHLRSLANALAKSISADLNNRTSGLDSRSGARAKVGVVKAKNTSSGVSYNITITQNIMPNTPDDKRKKIKVQQGIVSNKLASKNGVIALLNSAGVH